MVQAPGKDLHKLKRCINPIFSCIPVSAISVQKTRNYLSTCRKCPLINLCLWCPAHAYLESGAMDTRVEYFCRVAHARAAALGYTGPAPKIQVQ
jgi:sulfatase maturation enzyme AslB (radical SAM superfamily)